MLQRSLLQVLKRQKAFLLYINGPRQAGKTTLAEDWLQDNPSHFFSLDEINWYTAIAENPKGFLEQLPLPAVIDEVQRGTALFRELKIKVDAMRRSKGANQGQILLTGSADIMALPALADASVGRMQIFTLYPFSAVERFGDGLSVLPKLWDEDLIPRSYSTVNFAELIRSTTFPELALDLELNVATWMQSYLTTLLQRDVRDLAEISKIHELSNLLRMCASHMGGILNESSLARDVGMNLMTLRRYRTLLTHLFMLNLVAPWYRNIGKRFVKAPKIYLTDTLMALHLIGIEPSHLKARPDILGKTLENWVAMELTKQLNTLPHFGELYHFRTHDQLEIDFVIEKPNGQVCGIEIKAREKVTEQDFKGLKVLQSDLGEDFVRGFVVYLGRELVPFGKNLYALPLSALWQNPYV